MRQPPEGKVCDANKKSTAIPFKSRWTHGGESGIRTLGSFRNTAFRVLHLRPLGQLSVCIFQSAFSSLNFRSKNFWREKQERTLKNIRFLILKALINRGFSGGRNDQAALKFRVQLVMTTSIRFHLIIIQFSRHIT